MFGEVKFSDKTVVEDFFVDQNQKGAFFYSGTEQNVKLTITDSFVTCRLIYVDIEAAASIENQVATRAGTIYMQGSQLGIYSDTNRYQNCYNTTEGGIFYLVNTKLVEKSSTFFGI